MNNATEQIKERINVADVIGEYLKLEKAGSNYKALCPFHNEKTPSFMVNPERNFWYCFGCQKGGDIFSFVQEMEGIQFREALERLAEKAGVELPRFDPRSSRQTSQKKQLFEMLELASRFYQHQLKSSEAGKRILDYLHQRNITDLLVERFELGFAPEGWDNILSFLRNKGYKPDDIEKTGLLVSNSPQSGSQKIYDRFRGRIMFPIRDLAGKTVGFSARVVPGGDEKTAKYINTPQTSIYDKSTILYGLFEGKNAIRTQDAAVIVEGNADVIASHFAGVENVVAISGTALTERQVRIVKRYTQNVKLCFDMDEAGQLATEKSIATCLKNGMDVEIIFLPQGSKDVGDLVKLSAPKWVSLAASGMPVMEFFFRRVLEKYDSGDVRNKKVIAQRLLNVIKDIADPIEQSYWLKKLAATIDVEEETLTKVLEKVNLKKDYEKKPQLATNDSLAIGGKKSRRQILEERLLGLFNLYPLELEGRALQLDYQFEQEHSSLWRKLCEKEQTDSIKIDAYSLRVKYIRDEKLGLIENEIDPLREWDVVLEELDKIARENKIKALRKDINKAKDAGDENAVDLMTEELAKIIRQKSE